MQFIWSWVFMAVISGTAVGQPAEIELISKEEPLAGWDTYNGEEFPGAKVALEVDEQESLPDNWALKLVGDFTGGGGYVEANYAFEPPVDIGWLSVWVKHPGADELALRLIDATGQCHQLKLHIDPSGRWQQVRFPLQRYFKYMGTPQAVPGVKQYQKWGGANDGKWHGPAASIHILTRPFDKQNRVQTLWLRDLQITPQAPTVEREPLVSTIRLDHLLRLGEVDWVSSDGREFPGATVRLTAERVDGEYAFRLAGDFTGGGAYVEMRRRFRELDVLAVKAFRLELKSENVRTYNIRLIDGSGQVFQRKGFHLTPDGKWHEVTVAPASFAGAEHWSGAADGQWHPPAGMLSILLNNASALPDKRPVIYMRNMVADVVLPAVARPASFDEDFEDAATGWETHGDTGMDDTAGVKGSRGLVLSRGQNDFHAHTAAAGPVFPAAAGTWEVAGSVRPDLFYRDDSFHGAIEIQWLNSTGASIGVSEVFLAMKQGPWQSFRQRVEAPAGTVQARLAIRLNKTYGTLAVDDLSVAQLFAAPAERGITAIKAWSDRAGNLFYPEDALTMHVQVTTAWPLDESQRRGRIVVRDYWGAEQGESLELDLRFAKRQQQVWLYEADVDLSPLPLEIGTYYEMHVEISREGAEPYRDFTAFARLPVAVTKRYPPAEVPFTSRNWDNRIKDYAVLSDRLGIRTYGIWSDWDAKPPHKVHTPGLDWADELGMGVVARTAVHRIEQRRAGYEDYTPEVLREGAKKLAETLGNHVVYISNGNEPHGDFNKVKENVAAYEAIYQGIKAANPGLTVIGTSVGPEEDYFRAGFQHSLDQYDFHTYEDYRRIRTLFARYEELFAKYGGRKPICSTELGLNSQGLTRRAVAISLIKKLTLFFEQGGAHCSWFGLLYPDPDGTKEYTAGQSHNVFRCRYRLYNPKLDAIAYYNMVNAICVKKYCQTRHYGDTEAYLFVDADGDCLQILWNDISRQEVFVPLPGTQQVQMIRIDGSSRTLCTGGQGVTVDVSSEPLLLLYGQHDASLADNLGQPALRLASKLLPVRRGEVARFELAAAGNTADIVAEGPPGWQVESVPGATAATVQVHLKIPESTEAREVRLRISIGRAPQSELYLGIPVITD